MRIGLDITPLQTGHRFRGVGSYVFNLLLELAELEEPDEYYLLAYQGLEHGLPTLSNNFHYQYLPQFKKSGRLAAILSHQVALPVLIKKLKIELFHAPFISLDPSVPGLPFFNVTPTIVTIHDLTPLRFPEKFLSAYRKKIFYSRQLVAAKKSTYILTDSEHSKLDILDYLKIKENKVLVVPLGVRVQQIYATKPDSPYILHVGGDYFNKNISTLLQAYELLRKRGKVTHKLHLVGGYDRDASSIENSPYASDILRFTNISREEVVRQYCGASLFVFPSIYEGFGLPPLEAMAYEVPVIAASTSSLPHVLGSAAIFVPPFDVEGWVTAMENCIADTVLANSLRDMGKKHANQYTWKRTAIMTSCAYHNSI